MNTPVITVFINLTFAGGKTSETLKGGHTAQRVRSPIYNMLEYSRKVTRRS